MFPFKPCGPVQSYHPILGNCVFCNWIIWSVWVNKVLEEIPGSPPVEHNKRSNYQTRPEEVQDEADPFMFSGLLKEPHPESFSLVSACFTPSGECSHPHTPTLSLVEVNQAIK